MSFCLTLVSFALCVFSFCVFGDIIVENKDGINEYWYAAYISGENGDAEITDVFIRDSSSTSSFIAGTQTIYGFWAFQNDDGFVLPLSMRIRNSNNEQINSIQLITSLNYYQQFNFGSNFNLNSPAPPDNTNIEIINKDGINEWWHAFYVINLNPNGGELTNVEIRDQSDGSDWVTGYIDHNGHLFGEQATFYSFQNNNKWVLPLDIRLTNCGGQRIVRNFAIPNRIEFGIYDFGRNFNDATCPAPTPPTSTNNIMITKHQGYNPWWVALIIDNVSPGKTISTVELQDGRNDGTWTHGNYNDWGEIQAWTFDINVQGRQFELPFDIRITDTTGAVIEANDLVTAWDDGAMYDFGSNF